MQEQPKLKDLLEFPCQFTYKVMGYAKPELPEKVLEVQQTYYERSFQLRLVGPSFQGMYPSRSHSFLRST